MPQNRASRGVDRATRRRDHTGSDERVDGRRYAAPLPCDAPGTWQLRASGFLTDGKSVASGIVEIDWPPAGAQTDASGGGD